MWSRSVYIPQLQNWHAHWPLALFKVSKKRKASSSSSSSGSQSTLDAYRRVGPTSSKQSRDDSKSSGNSSNNNGSSVSDIGVAPMAVDTSLQENTGDRFNLGTYRRPLSKRITVTNLKGLSFLTRTVIMIKQGDLQLICICALCRSCFARAVWRLFWRSMEQPQTTVVDDIQKRADQTEPSAGIRGVKILLWRSTKRRVDHGRILGVWNGLLLSESRRSISTVRGRVRDAYSGVGFTVDKVRMAEFVCNMVTD